AVALIACSALFILVLRARHDPAINQANPASFRDLAYVVGRRQYDVAGIWRVLVTLAFAVLAVFGARWHRVVDPRGWRAMLLLFACGSLGVIAYLNLKAGTSFGWAFVPDASRHEARDRDY